jgi:hypothetical protein
MTWRSAVLCVAGLAVSAGCGSVRPALARGDAGVARDLRAGAAALRDVHDEPALRRELLRVLRRLRNERPASSAGRRSRDLAVRAFASALAGVQSRLDFVRNDSGNVAAATHDARASDRRFGHAVRLLEAAMRALGLPYADVGRP